MSVTNQLRALSLRLQKSTSPAAGAIEFKPSSTQQDGTTVSVFGFPSLPQSNPSVVCVTENGEMLTSTHANALNGGPRSTLPSNLKFEDGSVSSIKCGNAFDIQTSGDTKTFEVKDERLYIADGQVIFDLVRDGGSIKFKPKQGADISFENRSTSAVQFVLREKAKFSVKLGAKKEALSVDHDSGVVVGAGIRFRPGSSFMFDYRGYIDTPLRYFSDRKFRARVLDINAADTGVRVNIYMQLINSMVNISIPPFNVTNTSGRFSTASGSYPDGGLSVITFDGFEKMFSPQNEMQWPVYYQEGAVVNQATFPAVPYQAVMVARVDPSNATKGVLRFCSVARRFTQDGLILVPGINLTYTILN